ncbi:MAG: DNA-protecting protein DprA [Actinobacteria bacterium]|nr:DNA-protecting protein DprA [Actinomycetota bacterium]
MHSVNSAFKNCLSKDQIAAAALCALPKIGPKRLMTLLKHHDPQTAWAVVQGRAKPSEVVAAMLNTEGLVTLLRHRATQDLQDQIEQRCIRAGIKITIFGDENYPRALILDLAPPAVLFYFGDLSALNNRRVGMVGTRSATASGRYLASHIAHDLATNDVCIVSGLARGIDAWAHRGALRALESRAISPLTSRPAGRPAEQTLGRPVGVVASGLDVVYPRENAQLWQDIATQGALISESSPGSPPEAFRFPLRNRILAALSEVLVVVESRDTGGSMITVDEAQKRDVTVLAVPGSPRNVASNGTNQLIQQGCLPIIGAQDVLVALGLDNRRAQENIYDPRVRLSSSDQNLVSMMAGSPFTLDNFVLTSRLSTIDAAVSLGRLEALGWVVENAGWWEVIEVRQPLH